MELMDVSYLNGSELLRRVNRMEQHPVTSHHGRYSADRVVLCQTLRSRISIIYTIDRRPQVVSQKLN